MRNMNRPMLIQLARSLCVGKYRNRMDLGKVVVLGLFVERNEFVCLRVVNYFQRQRVVTYLALWEERNGLRHHLWVMPRPPDWPCWRPERFMCDIPDKAERLFKIRIARLNNHAKTSRERPDRGT